MNTASLRGFSLLPLLSGLLLSLLTSCKKDLALDYHQVAPIYVVEASVSDDGMVARISQTNAMDDNSSASDISQAEVTVTGDDGTNVTLHHTRNGYYRADRGGVAGVSYRIDIRLDGHHFSSTSVMQQKPRFGSFRVVRQKMLSEWFQMGDLRLEDIPNEDNWYFAHVYRNGIGYRWAVLRDNVDPNHELQQLFTFFREGSTDSDVLQEGDLLRIEIRTIDERAYDYLYSMQLMDNTGTNPVQNFTGGCLGYFSAFSQVTYEYRYRLTDVEESD